MQLNRFKPDIENTVNYARSTESFRLRPPNENAKMVKLPPGRTRDRDAVAMLLGGSELGIPRPGNYRMRAGFALNKDFITWSDFYEFTIEEEE
jgi:hypothetical protein